jgi:hypothetical protein
MTPPREQSWAPSPELLAAYFDGEFEGRDELVPMRQRLEDWLAGNPEARAEFTECRRLKQLWLETTPPDPGQAVWWKILDEMECRKDEGAARKDEGGRMKDERRRPWKKAAVALAACLFLIVYLARDSKVAEETPFPVATTEEVVILHIEGADTGMIVVGELPVQGPLVLIGAGEVVFNSVKPAPPDNMIPEVHAGGPGAPIIWAQAEPEEE